MRSQGFQMESDVLPLLWRTCQEEELSLSSPVTGFRDSLCQLHSSTQSLEIITLNLTCRAEDVARLIECWRRRHKARFGPQNCIHWASELKQGKNLEPGADAEAMEQCSPWLALSAFL